MCINCNKTREGKCRRCAKAEARRRSCVRRRKGGTESLQYREALHGWSQIGQVPHTQLIIERSK